MIVVNLVADGGIRRVGWVIELPIDVHKAELTIRSEVKLIPTVLDSLGKEQVRSLPVIGEDGSESILRC